MTPGSHALLALSLILSISAAVRHTSTPDSTNADVWEEHSSDSQVRASNESQLVQPSGSFEVITPSDPSSTDAAPQPPPAVDAKSQSMLLLSEHKSKFVDLPVPASRSTGANSSALAEFPFLYLDAMKFLYNCLTTNAPHVPPDTKLLADTLKSAEKTCSGFFSGPDMGAGCTFSVGYDPAAGQHGFNFPSMIQQLNARLPNNYAGSSLYFAKSIKFKGATVTVSGDVAIDGGVKFGAHVSTAATKNSMWMQLTGTKVTLTGKAQFQLYNSASFGLYKAGRYSLSGAPYQLFQFTGFIGGVPVSVTIQLEPVALLELSGTITGAGALNTEISYKKVYTITGGVSLTSNGKYTNTLASKPDTTVPAYSSWIALTSETSVSLQASVGPEVTVTVNAFPIKVSLLGFVSFKGTAQSYNNKCSTQMSAGVGIDIIMQAALPDPVKLAQTYCDQGVALLGTVLPASCMGQLENNCDQISTTIQTIMPPSVQWLIDHAKTGEQKWTPWTKNVNLAFTTQNCAGSVAG